jgi:hypothetical protein
MNEWGNDRTQQRTHEGLNDLIYERINEWINKLINTEMINTLQFILITVSFTTLVNVTVLGISCAGERWIQQPMLCRHKWLQHVHRMEDNRLAKQLLNYHPKGRRRLGRPLKRLLDDMTAETETGHPGLNSWWNMMMKMLCRVGWEMATAHYEWRVKGRENDGIKTIFYFCTISNGCPYLMLSFVVYVFAGII